jgi:hypothetical protein
VIQVFRAALRRLRLKRLTMTTMIANINAMIAAPMAWMCPSTKLAVA